MHKIHEKEFTLEDFSHEHLNNVTRIHGHSDVEVYDSREHLLRTIDILNIYRAKYNQIGGKEYWLQIIQLLPSSYNQKRTVMLNYEVLANIYRCRKDHKLDEWRELCKWIEGLPYGELICGDGALMTPNEQREKIGYKCNY